MKSYVFLLIKRLFRLLPMAVLAAALLLAAFGAVLGASQRAFQAENAKFSVALCGSTDDQLVQLGISALQSLDDTRFSVEIRTMTEAQARQALMQQEIGAYVVIPEGFVKSALYGNVPTLQYVTLTGNAGLAAIFQQEVTQVISDILLSAQKGVYGIAGALRDAGEDPYVPMNGLALEYVALALSRGDTYTLRVLGVSGGLSFADYLCCGVTVLLLFLLCLSFAPMLVQRDVSVNRMLAAKGLGGSAQALAEFSVVLLGLGVLTAALLAAAGPFLPFPWWAALPAAVPAAAFGFFVFSLTRELIGGVLLHFFLSLSLCFLSGCLYPLPFFPDSVQQLAAWLPADHCRRLLSACAAGESPLPWLAVLAGWTAVFLAAAVWVRQRRLGRAEV